MFDYQVGSSLAVDNPTYIEQRANHDLYEALFRANRDRALFNLKEVFWKEG
ncbi:MAG: hypothetical protein GVY04_06390 [Cyanobacteria bacterium]|jgi:hypothetical protein|nr:hypothetical protein [Cyanobacteria bacterium GSL.Bin1]